MGTWKAWMPQQKLLLFPKILILARTSLFFEVWNKKKQECLSQIWGVRKKYYLLLGRPSLFGSRARGNIDFARDVFHFFAHSASEHGFRAGRRSESPLPAVEIIFPAPRITFPAPKLTFLSVTTASKRKNLNYTFPAPKRTFLSSKPGEIRENLYFTFPAPKPWWGSSETLVKERISQFPRLPAPEPTFLSRLRRVSELAYVIFCKLRFPAPTITFPASNTTCQTFKNVIFCLSRFPAPEPTFFLR